MPPSRMFSSYRIANVFFGFITIAFLTSCRPPGKIVPESGPGNKMTIQRLAEDWDGYNIHFMVWPADHPLAIIFDPKDDCLKVTGPSWIEVKDQKEISRAIKRIQLWYDPQALSNNRA